MTDSATVGVSFYTAAYGEVVKTFTPLQIFQELEVESKNFNVKVVHN